MAKVRWTPAANRDLEALFLYIGRDQRSPAAAARMVQELVAKSESYAEQPLLGAERAEIGPAIRAFQAYRYVLFYRPSELGIDILRVIHGSRDVARVFRRNEP